jgi:hypothetical protein
VLAQACRPSAVEYRATDVVSQPLIAQDKIVNLIRQLTALPVGIPERMGFDTIVEAATPHAPIGWGYNRFFSS